MIAVPFAGRLQASSFHKKVVGFFRYYTKKREKPLDKEAIKRDIRSSFIDYFTFSVVVLFNPISDEEVSDFFKAIFLAGPFISNMLAGIFQRILSKKQVFKKRSRLIQNILFTLIGASWVATMVTLLRDSDATHSASHTFFVNSIVYGMTSILIYLLEPEE